MTILLRYNFLDKYIFLTFQATSLHQISIIRLPTSLNSPLNLANRAVLGISRVARFDTRKWLTQYLIFAVNIFLRVSNLSPEW